jgi:hypothetical protein
MSASRSELGLARQWRRWVADALVRGCTPQEVARALIDEGVEEAIAVREIGIIDDALAPLAKERRRTALLLRMLATVDADAGPLERRAPCGAAEFHARHFTRYRPVVFEGGCATMKAARWSFAGLRARCGEIEIEVGYPEPATLTLAEVIDRIDAGAPPEFYVVSHNRVLAGPLVQLRDDLEPLPEFLDPIAAPATANLWLGPANTESPLHHDTTHVYFCQLVGQKRYQLVAPWEPELLRAEIVRGWDSSFDVDAPGEVRVHEVVLEPGDALYLPTGWWHRVVALTPSISVSMRDFAWPCDHSWYAPGVVT